MIVKLLVCLTTACAAREPACVTVPPAPPCPVQVERRHCPKKIETEHQAPVEDEEEYDDD